MKRTLPSTSHEANKKATLEMREGHYRKIVNSLSVLGTCNYEKISEHCGLDKHSIGRRTKEMIGLGMIYWPGTQTPTKSGRMAMDYCLTGQGMPRTDNAVNEYKKGEKSSTDYSKQIIDGAKQLNLL